MVCKGLYTNFAPIKERSLRNRDDNACSLSHDQASLTVQPNHKHMYWTLELASKLEDAPWPATKDELIDYAMRSGAPMEVVENLQELEEEGEVYETIEDVWPDYPTKEDFLFNEDEY